MARYIDADKLLESVTKHDFNDWLDYDIFKYFVKEAPTADVAPKSEVARKIFAEIDNMLVGFVSLFHSNISKATIEQNKDEQEVNLVALSVTNATRNCLAELKKKYIGEQK